MSLRLARGFGEEVEDREEFERAFLERLRPFFSPGPLWVARAPGRLDVLGGIIDYAGGLVCEWPLAEAVWVALQPRSDLRLRLATTASEPGIAPTVEMSLEDFYRQGRLLSYEEARLLFAEPSSRHWAAYVAGIFFVLLAEGKVARFPHGATLGVVSHVPPGAGVASSAALEVATMQAVCAAYGLSLEPLEKARLCQRAENLVAGAPCGIMDQITALLGQKGALLLLLCQPYEVKGFLPLPSGVQVAGIHTQVKHSVGGSRYTSTRVGTFMGHRIIEEHLRRRAPWREKDPLEGYVCRISPEEFAKVYRRILPEKMKGATFLRRYGGTRDPVTRIEPRRTYKVRSRVEHMVLEQARVERFLRALEAYERTRDSFFLRLAGKQMYASHWSYTKRCGLGAQEADLLVRLAREEGEARGVYGAKITGGGSGGTVAFLGTDALPEAVARIAQRYAERTGHRPEVFLGSSPGAERVGVACYEMG